MRVLPLALAATAVAAAVATAAITYKSTPHVGIVLLLPGGAPDKCTTVATDLIAGEKEKTTVWKVLNFCGGTPKVTVGHFIWADDGKVYRALKDCSVAAPGSGATGTADISCTIEEDCRVRDFSFSVCIDGKKVVDPELRIKGGSRPPGCQALTVVEAEAACEKMTQSAGGV